jgi:hypothetical protein
MNRRQALQAFAGTMLGNALLPAAALDQPQRAPQRLSVRDLSVADQAGAPDLSKADLDCVPAAAAGRTAEVRDWLIACSARDMTRCTLDLPQRDAYLSETPWLSRAIAAYQFIRADVSRSERQTLDDWFLRNAEFNRRHIDIHLEENFPRRSTGDYSVRGRDARGGAMTGKRCSQTGPAISVLSQWYNNRRASSMLFVAQAGALLGDTSLTDSAKRYVREWITYSVWPGGEQGEWQRNGDYGYVCSGLAYGASNIALALLVAMWLDALGDASLLRFSTSEGLFGTQSTDAPKTIWTAFDTHVALLDGSLSLRDEQGRAFDALVTPYGRPMHASWYLPAAHRYDRSRSLDLWAKASEAGGLKLDDPFGHWRGMCGIFVDVRRA